MISQKTIDEVKARINLLEIIGESVQLKRQGSGYVGLCPFHGERSPSFHVKDHDQYYHCFGCGKSGNAFSFLMDLKGLSFPEAVEELALRYGVEVEKVGAVRSVKVIDNSRALFELNHKAFLFFRSELAKRVPQVVSYAIERKLTKEAVQAFGIGFAPSGNSFTQYAVKQDIQKELLLESGLVRRNQRGDLYDSLRDRLVFPIFIDGKRIAGFGGRIIPALLDSDSTAPKYLNSPETPLYHKSKILYGLPQAIRAIRETHTIFVVEGYLDVIGLWQAGVQNVVATCGTALTEEHVKKLSRLAKKIILLFDADNAGRAAAAKSFLTFLNIPVDVWAVYLEEGEDPDTVALQYGKNTQRYLDSKPKVQLIDSYFDSLLVQYGVMSADELGPSARGSLASDLGATISQVKDSITRLELAKRISSRLKIPLERFESVIPQSGKRPEALVPKIEVDSNAEIRSWQDLPHLDQSVISLVMGKKEEFAARVLKNSTLCHALTDSARGFIESLHLIFSTDSTNYDKKEAVKQLLKEYGKGWGERWKMAHEIYGDKGSNAERQFEDCVAQAERQELNRLLVAINTEVATAYDEAEKASLLQQVVDIQRRQRAIASR